MRGDLQAELDRCDAELAAIAAAVAAGQEKDYDLVVLGQVDWEIERRLLLQELRQRRDPGPGRAEPDRATRPAFSGRRGRRFSVRSNVISGGWWFIHRLRSLYFAIKWAF